MELTKIDATRFTVDAPCMAAALGLVDSARQLAGGCYIEAAVTRILGNGAVRLCVWLRGGVQFPHGVAVPETVWVCTKTGRIVRTSQQPTPQQRTLVE